MLAALLGLGAQDATLRDAPVRWAWSGGVTSRGAVVKARVSRGGIRAVRHLGEYRPVDREGGVRL